MLNLEGKTVACDFDGVLSTYEHGWQGDVPEDPPVPGALQFVTELLAMGAKVVIMSTRAATPEGRDGILAWLDRHNFPPEIEVTHEKVAAIAYVDDRAITFRRTPAGKGNWAHCLDQIEELAVPRH